ncbi:uncharacterized protein N0V96_010042 [Colletotrichum fioriniae]|uniref:uncharacterized protein n=1 Tax=Colletotrichum fioriniae TaxID=710243 RepID=UPI0032DAF176|nr:hypothetical protein N0V96_010042 [Colletotrichum fioriniae]
MASIETDSSTESRKLVLCFDGTGNSFSGSGSDTNVVKLLRMLDRNDKHQYHYYQTGIGTYDVDDTSVNKSWVSEVRSNISQKIDMGFGTTFDSHVIAGYRFLMRYYETTESTSSASVVAPSPPDLCRMVNTVGLLCKGNEEMVPFAYKLYQDHLAKVKKSGKEDKSAATNPSDVQTPNAQATKDTKGPTVNTFETPASPPDTPIDEAFPNGITIIEKAGEQPTSVKGTATFVRHAVAVDEFRVKFKPALLAQDIIKPPKTGKVNSAKKRHEHIEDIKEVWFPGNHGDVGGGWSAIKDDPTWKAKELQRIEDERLEDDDAGTDEIPTYLRNPTLWGRFLRLIGRGKKEDDLDDTEDMQLSDIPLSWMIRELEIADQDYEKKTGKTGLKWRPRRLNRFKDSIYHDKYKQSQALHGWIHNILRFGHGMGYFKPMMWYLLGGMLEEEPRSL